MQAARLIENSAKPSFALESWSADKFGKQTESASERDKLLLLATDRFCSFDDQHNLGLDQYKEAFYALASTASDETLSKIAKQLSTNAYAPRVAVLYLANENVRIAEPVLRFAPLLSQLDMVQLIEQHDLRHARLIASRPDLGQAIVKRLMNIKDAEIMETLANNRAVTFNSTEKAEFEALVAATKRVEAKPKAKQEQRAKRVVDATAKPQSAVKPKFIVSVKRNSRKVAVQSKPLEQDLLAAAARGGRLPGKTSDTTTEHQGEDFAQALEKLALARNHQSMASLMKKRFNLAMNTCREVLEDQSGDTLAVLLSAAGIDGARANRINLLTFPEIGGSVEQARRAIQFFSNLDTASSLEAVEQWPKSTLFTPRHETYLDDADGGINRGDTVHKTDKDAHNNGGASVVNG